MRRLATCWLLLAATPVHAGDTARALFGAGGIPAPCAASERRQFDFWVGPWRVTQRDGSPGGRNHVSRVVDGCALLEAYDGAQQQGRSLSAYRTGDRQWLQTYVDSSGLTLRLAGSFADGRMHLADAPRSIPSAGLTLASQVTWTPQADGAVDQLWRLSRDGGQSWSTSFDGRYQAVASVPEAAPAAADACGAARPAYRALDGLIGTWLVEDAAGTPLGRSTVESRLGGCLLEERLDGPRGYRAHRMIAFDRYVREWIWFHADNRGHVERHAARSGDVPMHLADELPGGPGLCLRSAVAGPTFTRGACEGAAEADVRYRRASDSAR